MKIEGLHYLVSSVRKCETSLVVVEPMKIFCHTFGLKSSKILLQGCKELFLGSASGHSYNCFSRIVFVLERKSIAIILTEKVTFSNDKQKRN